MVIQNALNLQSTGIITHDGAGVFTGSAVTQGGVLLAGASNSVTDTGVLAKGTMIVGDGVLAPALLPIGTNNYVMTADSAQTEGVKWAQLTQQGYPAPTTVNTTSLFSDFIQRTSNDPWETGISPIDIGSLGSSNNTGVVQLKTSVLNNIPSTNMFIGGGEITLYMRHAYIGAPPVLNTSLMLGYSNVPDVLYTQTDRVCFLYNRAISTNWVISTMKATVLTNTITGVAMPFDGTFQILKMVINALGTSADFFIDGVLVGTQSVNMPLTTTPLRFGAIMGNWGSNAPKSQIDYLGWNKVGTFDRS